MPARRLLAFATASFTALTVAAVVPTVAHAASQQAIHVPAPTRVAAQNLPFQAVSQARSVGPLGRDGRPSGSGLPSAPASGAARPGVAATGTTTSGITPFAVTKKITGLNYADSGCNCYPPDVNAAVGGGFVVEVVNRVVGIYNSSTGARVLTEPLGTLLATANLVDEPRVLYDPTWRRWVIIANDDSTGTLYLGVSVSSDPTGSWFSYPIPFPAGVAIVDAPMVGMDRDALIFTSNNYSFDGVNYTYVNSTAFTASKAIVYNANGFAFTLTPVAFGTAPSISIGDPMIATNFDYLASLDATSGKATIYRISNSANKAKITLRGQADYTWSPPSRSINQPGTAATLSPGDGRILAPMAFDGSRLWFAHGVEESGLPTVHYGYIAPGSLTVQTASAFTSATSDDFNPSIVVQNYNGGRQILLNWSYTDSPNGVPLSAAYKFHVGALSALHGDTYTPAGFSTSTETRIGYSSAVPEYDSATCPEGLNALVGNVYFNSSGQWQTQLARVHAPC